MKMVVGLGNPGRRYLGTRHNVGFEVLAGVADRFQAGKPRNKFEAELAEVSVNGEKVLLLSPLTYMNASGRSVRAAADFFGIPPEEILVVCDDFQLPAGKLRFRPRGSSGGQKGLADVLARFGEAVPRLRLGIGPLKEGWDVADFVLSRFSADERAQVDESVRKAIAGVEDWVRQGMAFCMNRYNGGE